jgi:hypothetical protein
MRHSFAIRLPGMPIGQKLAVGELETKGICEKENGRLRIAIVRETGDVSWEVVKRLA